MIRSYNTLEVEDQAMKLWCGLVQSGGIDSTWEILC